MKYLTPKQHLRRLRFERFTTWLKYVGLSFMGACALWVLMVLIQHYEELIKEGQDLLDILRGDE